MTEILSCGEAYEERALNEIPIEDLDTSIRHNFREY